MSTRQMAYFNDDIKEELAERNNVYFYIHWIQGGKVSSFAKDKARGQKIVEGWTMAIGSLQKGSNQAHCCHSRFHLSSAGTTHGMKWTRQIQIKWKWGSHMRRGQSVNTTARGPWVSWQGLSQGVGSIIEKVNEWWAPKIGIVSGGWRAQAINTPHFLATGQDK